MRLEDKLHAALIFAAATMLRLVMRTARNTISAQINFTRLLPLRWSVPKGPLKHLVKTLINSYKNLDEMWWKLRKFPLQNSTNFLLQLIDTAGKYPIIGGCDN